MGDYDIQFEDIKRGVDDTNKQYLKDRAEYESKIKALTEEKFKLKGKLELMVQMYNEHIERKFLDSEYD